MDRVIISGIKVHVGAFVLDGEGWMDGIEVQVGEDVMVGVYIMDGISVAIAVFVIRIVIVAMEVVVETRW